MTFKKVSLAYTFVLGSICASSIQADIPSSSSPKYIPSNPVYLGFRDVEYTPEQAILGISAIRYEETDLGSHYWLLSDDSGYSKNTLGQRASARLFKVSDIPLWNKAAGRPYSAISEKSFLELYSHSVKQLTLESSHSLKAISCGQVDMESFDFMDNDELLISSEQSIGYGFCWDGYIPTFIIPPLSRQKGMHIESHFLKVAPQGTVNGIYALPAELVEEGIQCNKGIESLARFPGSDNYVAIFEDALDADKEAWIKKTRRVSCPEESDNETRESCIQTELATKKPPRRVLFFSMAELKKVVAGVISPAQFDYNPEPIYQDRSERRKPKPGFPKKRVTDVHAVNKSQFLVLETTYTQYQPLLDLDSEEGKKARDRLSEQAFIIHTSPTEESYAEVFLVERPKGLPDTPTDGSYQRPTKRLEKKLVLSTRIFAESHGQYWLSLLNFEGLTLGPTLNDGSRVLVLVNNNDALAETPENTRLVFFKINGGLFQGH